VSEYRLLQSRVSAALTLRMESYPAVSFLKSVFLESQPVLLRLEHLVKLLVRIDLLVGGLNR
jgi:hypothetical protein